MQDSELKRILKERFGLDSFREKQLDIIKSIINGNNNIVIMPTGGGKSLCYQLPAVVFDTPTIVISPLIALMEDQVIKLESLGIPACYINSTVSYNEIEKRINDMLKNVYKIIYIAPERLDSKCFFESLKTIKISHLVVDEAHCISTWGKDFRISYKRLEDKIPKLSIGRISAFTATSTDAIISDIRSILNIEDAKLFRFPPTRKNLYYSISITDNKLKSLLSIISDIAGYKVVYAATKRDVENIATYLSEQGINADFFHAGIQSEKKKQKQIRFINGQIDVMVATTAFGMGIDKPDIRAVIHFDMPLSIEDYFQESGRAGRDGKDSSCILLYTPGDIYRRIAFLRRGMVKRRDFYNIISYINKFGSYGVIKNPDFTTRRGVKLLADYSSAFGYFIAKSSGFLTDNIDRAGYKIAENLYMSSNGSGNIFVEEGDIIILKKQDIEMDIVDIVMEIQQERMNKLFALNYLIKSPICRSRVASVYFDMPSPRNCGRCDNCKGNNDKIFYYFFAEAILTKAVLLFVESYNIIYNKRSIISVLIGKAESNNPFFQAFDGIEDYISEYTVKNVIEAMINAGYLFSKAGKIGIADRGRALLEILKNIKKDSIKGVKDSVSHIRSNAGKSMILKEIGEAIEKGFYVVA